MIIKSMQSNQVDNFTFACAICCDKWYIRSFFFSLIRTIWLLRIIPLDFGVSYHHTLATAREPLVTLDFGVLNIRALTQNIKRKQKIYVGIQSAMEFGIKKKHSNHDECYFNQSSYRQKYNLFSTWNIDFIKVSESGDAFLFCSHPKILFAPWKSEI